jgi:hypothetical protein
MEASPRKGEQRMNRRARRAAAARARRTCGRTGYEARLTSAGLALAHHLRGKVVHAVIEHDAWCGIYRGAGCNCVPNMSSWCRTAVPTRSQSAKMEV